MSESASQNSYAADGSRTAASAVWTDIAGIPTTPIATDGPPVASLEDDIAGIPTTPIATGGPPVYPGNSYPFPDYPLYPFPYPGYPSTLPSVTLFGQARFLNASTNGATLDAYIDGQNVFSGSSFATVSVYLQVSDGFHTVTIRKTNGQILYQQTLAFVAGEKITLVILDTANGVTLAKVSDMGCTNVPSGYGCLRVANMSYSGSGYDVRTFQNQIAFSGVGYKDVTSYKQAAAGNHTFFVTGSQLSVTSFGELPVILLAAFAAGSCPGCTVANPILTFSVSVEAGKAYTSYIIGNPWSNLFRVYTLEE